MSKEDFGVRLWKVIRNEWGVHFIIGEGRRVKFWSDSWCDDSSLRDSFPNLYTIGSSEDLCIVNAWEQAKERDL